MDPHLNLPKEEESLPEEAVLFGDTLLSYEGLTEERAESRVVSTSATSLSESEQEREQTVKNSIYSNSFLVKQPRNTNTLIDWLID
jgi:hypothetical protein